MLRMTKSTMGATKGTTTWAIWSHDWSKCFDIDLTDEEAKTFLAKKTRVKHVSWMQVLANSCKKSMLGTYAVEVNALKELL